MRPTTLTGTVRRRSHARVARLVPLARLALVMCVAGGAAACGERANTRAGADSTLARDLALARGETPTDRDLTRAGGAAAEPELHDVALGAPTRPSAANVPASRTVERTVPRAAPLPAGSSVDRVRAPVPASVPATTPAPSTTPVPAPAAPTPVATTPAPDTAPTPAATPSAPAGGAATGAGSGLRTGTMAAGATLRLSPHIRVCTNVNSVGDVFEATLMNAVSGTDGATLPAGANVVLRVTGLTRSGDDAVLAFELQAVGVTGHSYALTPVDAGGAVSGSARTATALQANAGPATAEEVTRFGTCVPRNGELTVTVTRGVRVGAGE